MIQFRKNCGKRAYSIRAQSEVIYSLSRLYISVFPFQSFHFGVPMLHLFISPVGPYAQVGPLELDDKTADVERHNDIGTKRVRCVLNISCNASILAPGRMRETVNL